jgi:serine/threonine protein kinase
MGITHRDIKPLNILINPESYEIKICDFGSAKKLSEIEPNSSSICALNYRAPELLFGNTSYDSMIDVWSIGCILGEMVLESVLFKADNP